MTDTILSSLQIQKLGHNIKEIRERALHNVISKLEFSPMLEKDMGRIKEILQKLFGWFNLKPLSHENAVLKLMKRILESQHGFNIINFYTPKMLINELVNIGKVVSKSSHSILDDIVNVIDSNRMEEVYVPRLVSEFSLSNRTSQGDHLDGIGTTATTIRENIDQDASIDLRLGLFASDRTDTTNITTPKSMNVNAVSCRYCTLPWQPLVGPDCHVLESVEESLRNPSQATTLMHSCDFFEEVLVQDFPAEVFLQRPAIVMLFQHLLSTCRSSRITTAVLVCLNRLTNRLKTRIHVFSDPNTHNLKLNNFFSSSLPSPASGDHSNTSTTNCPSEEISFLKSKQMPIPQFCLSTINCVLNYLYNEPSSLTNINDRPTRKICQVGINTSLLLLPELISILKLCFTSEFWQHSSFNTSNKEILQMFQECLIKYGDILEHFRVDLISNHNQRKRITYLHLISNLIFLIDILSCDEIEKNIPKCLRTALSAIILDASLSRLFPEMHQSILEIVKKFDGKYEVDCCSKYEEIKDIFDSMTNAIKFLNTCKELSLYESINLVKTGLISLEFHRDFSFIHKFLDICTSRLSLNCYEEDIFESIDYITESLLAHTDKEIQAELYKTCKNIIVDTIGTRFSSNTEAGSQILFLLRPIVLKEIILHGLSSENELIVDYANDILIHILKSKILVSSIIWQKTVEVLIPNLYLLLCYTSNKTSLSKTLISMLDPDKANKLHIPTEQVLKGNCCLLFSDNALIRAEAISRICWVLSVDPNSSKLLPKLSNLHDKSLGLICQISRRHDLNKTRNNQHFYEPSSLHQVMDLLTSAATVEPVIRRSALIQISVMTEDPLLHVAFQQRGGVAIMIASMRNALTETNYAEYPDSVIPIFATLKNVCVYSAVVREELTCNLEVFNFIIRGLVLFCTDERAKQDGSTLLFLLLFHNVLKGSYNKHDVSIPQLVFYKLNAPFTCKTYSTNSLATLPSPADTLLADKWCLFALRIHWNSEWCGGFKEIINWEKISYDDVSFNTILKLSESDLDSLRYASLEFCIQENLKKISTGSSHENIKNALNLLTNCINLYNLVKYDYAPQINITEFPWKECFLKFIETKPGSNDDSLLLTEVIHFLVLLTSIYEKSEDSNWISTILKSKVHTFCDVLDPEFSDGSELKKINQALLKLIAISASNEQSFLCLYKIITLDNNNVSDWTHLVVQIVEYLKFNNTQHFYNLAYLDSLLSCLVQLTMVLGWSNKDVQNNAIPNKLLLSKLINGLCELFESFHSGKGSSASSSLMGLSITRNVLIILNHTLVELHQYNVRDWEDLFLNTYLNEENILTDFSALLSNRDVILRAGVIQLFTGFSSSLKLAIKFVQNFRYNHVGVWDTFLSIILDHEEASIVKENAAALLSNILYHSVQNHDDLEIVTKLLPVYTNSSNAVQSLIRILEKHNIYKQIEIILNCLYIKTDFYCDCTTFESITLKTNLSALPPSLSSKKEECIFAYTKNIPLTMHSISSNGSSSTADNQPIPTTPGLIKNLAQFVNQLLLLSAIEMGDILQENDIIRIFFRCIVVPTKEIRNRKDLTNYCEIIFMNKAIINTISTAVNASSVCRQAVLHARDCLHILISLLNSNLFCTEFELLHLRDELWQEIYNLLTNILQTNSAGNINSTKSIESVKVISIIQECGFDIFIETLCDSIGRHSLLTLQHSALTVLISLLRVATISEVPNNIMQNLFDTTLSPRFDFILPYEKQFDSESPNIMKTTNNPDKKTMQLTLLENIYFGNMGTKLRTPRTIDESICSNKQKNEVDSVKFLKSGGELCKILIKLHELHKIRNINNSKLKYILLSGLTGILLISLEAKQYAFQNNFMINAIQQLKDIYIKLSLENITSLRKIADKRRLHPILREMDAIIGLLTNFMIGSVDIKKQASILGLADLVHKLWTWCCTQNGLIINVLRMLCTFSTNCLESCQSLTSTSAIAGYGPRKQPNFSCLLNVIVSQIGKEMDLISRTHDFAVLHLCFHLLQNSCKVSECRTVIAKSNLLQFISRLHPAITKRQKSYQNIEFIWLNFLLIFTEYAEGQSCVTKIPDVFDLLLTMTNSPKAENKLTAMMILRNLVFYSPNRPRLLNYDDFMNILGLKLTTGSLEEQIIVVTIIWSLAANNQKAKLIFKLAQLDIKLHEAIKVLQISEDILVSSEQLMQMYNVLTLLRASEK